jgi:hypothetical protein
LLRQFIEHGGKSMTTVDSSFIANGIPSGIGPRATIGFYANAQTRRPSALSGPFTVGTLGVGGSAGVYGATDDTAIPPTATNWDQAGVVGTSINKHGVFGISSTGCGVMGQLGAKPTLLQSSLPAAAGVMGLTRDGYGAVGASDHGIGVTGKSVWSSGISGDSSYGNGIDASTAAGPAGIRGQAYAGDGYGVQGMALTNAGVFGITGVGGPTVPNLTTNLGGVNNVAGVVGSSAKQPGIIGTSKFVGVYGYCGAPDPMMNAGNGVEGHSTDGTGVLGVAGAQGPVPALVNIAGVVGSSDQQTGIIGTSNGIGVYGYCGNADHTKSGIGVYGRADRAVPLNYAGAFDGNVSINGALTVGGDLALLDSTVVAKVKNAVVPFPDGTRRVLHCMESPEHWFEDFGAARLKRGRTVVKLDANFAKVIKRGDYKVFLTPEGDCRGLYVRKSAASFEVREFGGGTSSIAFSYRIVGRRKDIRGHRRFAKIDVTLPVFPGRRRPPRGKLLARSRKGAGATPARRRRRRGKRA